MRQKIYSLTAILSVLLLSAFIAPNFKADTYKVDLEKSTLTWTGKKAVGGHNGTINLQSGSLLFDGKKLSGGNFVIDMASIKDADKSARLEGHLKSDDFFGVDKFATSTFTIKKVTGTGAKLVVSGDLTIKGITQSINFPASVAWNADGSVTATAEKIVVDRTKYGIKFKSQGILDIGDKFIYDNFELSVKLVAKK
jgi:polyisoprenoid-binding protein YceI